MLISRLKPIKEPLNSPQSDQLCNRSATQGPSHAAATPANMRIDKERPNFSAGTVSATANRYCWINALLLPIRKVAAQNNQKASIEMA